ASDTSTGRALNREHQLKTTPRTAKDMLQISNISRNNLQNVSTELPKHAMTVVTGVAGSGKSSLISAGFERNSNAIFIDQKP
ncbi:excinuclease ABC subunit UvrA, partial [Staphylococcus aureus]|nr:excinuclease ABC subunit UvrA [Staphylococcus aureus]